jgi:hypothetical protein
MLESTFYRDSIGQHHAVQLQPVLLLPYGLGPVGRHTKPGVYIVLCSFAMDDGCGGIIRSKIEVKIKRLFPSVSFGTNSPLLAATCREWSAMSAILSTWQHGRAVSDFCWKCMLASGRIINDRSMMRTKHSLHFVIDENENTLKNTCRLLMVNGANPNVDPSGPLFLAVVAGDTELRLLMEYAADSRLSPDDDADVRYNLRLLSVMDGLELCPFCLMVMQELVDTGWLLCYASVQRPMSHFGRAHQDECGNRRIPSNSIYPGNEPHG